MNKPHLIIIGQRVHTFANRDEGRAMRLRILARLNDHAHNHTFGEWARSQKLRAKFVEAHKPPSFIGGMFDNFFKKD